MCWWKKDKDPKFDVLELIDDQIVSPDIRDLCYSALVKDIVENNRETQVLKKIFFYMVCLVFVFTCLIGMIVMLIISCKADIEVADVVALISAFGSVVASIGVLPKTIAEHLFPKDSEQSRFSFIQGNRNSDAAQSKTSTEEKEKDYSEIF